MSVPQHARGPGTLVLHAWWGLNDFFKKLCDRLATEGFVALAPDLYHGKTATTIDEAKHLRSRMDRDLASQGILGALDYLQAHPSAKGQRLGMIGFSLGGFLGLGLVDKRPDELGAVIVFYAVRKGRFDKTRAAFQGHFAENDQYTPSETVREFEKLVSKSKREVEVHTYDGTKHWFFEEDRPEFDAKAAALAWERTVQFLHAKLR